MKFTNAQLWSRFQQFYTEFPSIQLAMDLSRMDFPDDFMAAMKPEIDRAFRAMAELERGTIANPDENRMVGHYWLRNPALAPTPGIRREIEETVVSIKSFAHEVHQGLVQGAAGPFKHVLVIGIGGSALGPQFVAKALGHPITAKLEVHFFDNTDPDGMDQVLAEIVTELGQTLVVVISKSGGTKETRNGMLEAKAAYEKAGLIFARHAVAVTGCGSELDQFADKGGWLRRFPMWDWVGGRTSVMSAVGLLPAALQGFSVDEMLAGAGACDALTRVADAAGNPAAQLALMWFYAGNGRGTKDMVILPYKDRLELFSKYLQQLVMESIGKELDINNRQVNQGIAVYGNKGSTDQHAYVQQLRDGLKNFFATFIEVLKDRTAGSIEVEAGVTSGDYLSGFLMGTRQALYENGRESITLTISEVSPFTVGVLIALYERAVGFYATLVNINAYHQPGVEAGKKAAGAVIALQQKLVELFSKESHRTYTVTELAGRLGELERAETIFKICEHLSRNPVAGIRRLGGTGPATAVYQRSA
jgi:glucose-6-phosphate isomerase